MHAFRIVNVFTIEGDRFSGNPLCVFEDARGLSDHEMQALARQMNLSETTFILPSDRGDARVRIFTPGYEMPFAGHPTLGTASVVAAGRDRVVLDMKAGLVPVTRAGNGWTLRAAKPPATLPVQATRAELARMVGLPEHAVTGEPLWVNTGVEQLVIPIATAELVRAAQPVPELLTRWGFSTERDEAMAYLWAADGAEWTVRFFFTSNGAVLEDPATGSACANLGGWHIAQRRAPMTATLRQGDAVGRPSRLDLRVDNDGGIYVTGSVFELGRGSVNVA
ncbi:MAG TPA: PhzF family phenazine biosynthesis protein [Kofleriaceae bacterium]|jgi:PhzF family phenazine biosynthesis protein|nr:PhzF family phenazine biosynthesis protein [Kofleriaceae bacterium]